MSAMRDPDAAAGGDDAGRRVNVDCQAALRPVHDGDWLQAHALELDGEGLRLRTAAGIAAGTFVRVRLQTAGVPRPIELSGEITGCAPAPDAAGFELRCRFPPAD